MRVLSLALATVAVGFAIISPIQLAAQTQDSLAVGTWVRLVGPTIGRMTGPVRALTPDTITLDLAWGGELNRSPRPVPWSAVSRAEVSLERHAYVGKGALIGFAAGAALTAFAATTSGDLAPGYVFAAGTVYLALPLAGLGALFGAVTRHEVWREITPPGRARPADVSQARGGAVGRPVADSVP